MWSPETLFRDYFLPFYPKDAALDLGAARTTDANPGANASFGENIRAAAATFVNAASVVVEPSLDLDFSFASVHRLSKALSRERRDKWLEERPFDQSTILQLVVHGTFYVGECIVRNAGGQWLIRRPLWESPVRMESPLGVADLAVFQWWLKSLADEAYSTSGVASLGDRFRTYVEEPFRASQTAQLPPWLDEGRKLPRLQKVKYDVFYKYLKANLPEVRDLGSDFPSPERFAELSFRYLDFLIVGGGRKLLISGLSSVGFFVFWIGPLGFEKSIFLESDSFPEPFVRKDGERIQVHFSREKRTLFHEYLWSGP